MNFLCACNPIRQPQSTKMAKLTCSLQLGMFFIFAFALGGCSKESRAISKLRAEAEKGDAVAQFKLGVRGFPNGLDAKDEAIAATWYRKAAEQGLPEAQNNLAFMLQMGRGVPRDLEESIRLYRKAAEKSLPQAQNNLGCFYREAIHQAEWKGGYGLPSELWRIPYKIGVPSTDPDFQERRFREEAMKWFVLAAEQGLPQAHLNVANLIYPDSEKDAALQAKAAKAKHAAALEAAKVGYAEAQIEVSGFNLYSGMWFSKEKFHIQNVEEALSWLRKAADQGNPDHEFLLAEVIDTQSSSTGVPNRGKQEEAVSWYRKAAEQGHPEAQSKLADCYMGARGVALDPVEAYKWALLSERGCEGAKGVKTSLKFDDLSAANSQKGKQKASEFKPRTEHYKRRARLGDAYGRLEMSEPLALAYDVVGRK